MEKATRKLCSGYSGDCTGYNHQQSLPQYHASKPDRSCAQCQPYAELLCPLDNSIRNDAIDTDRRQEQRESGEEPHRRAVEPWAGKNFVEPLSHRLRAEHRNLRIC